MKVSGKELRKIWSEFYESKGHKHIKPVSLIADGTTGVLFNVAGMQGVMPYLLGRECPLGTRIYNIQGCIRVNDIDEIGDNCHCSFFEMMGNWSLGDYFKSEKTAWTFELLTKHYKLNADKVESSVFAGDKVAKKDAETAELLKKLGITNNRIHFLPKKDNWWDLPDVPGSPCGPCNEWFYPDSEGNLVEIGNDVYMQYLQVKTAKDGEYRDLEKKCVDTGFGFERNLMFLNGVKDVYETDLFERAVKTIESLSGEKYYGSKQRSFRIVADHTRAAVMMIGDEKKLTPNNVGAGYILRRLIRRAVRHGRNLGFKQGDLAMVAETYFEVYNEAYPLLAPNKEFILSEINKEEEKFLKTLEDGLKELNKLIDGMKKFTPNNKVLAGQKVFRLFDTFGFPMEITEELAKEQGFTVDIEGYEKAFSEHREKSKGLEKGTAAGGLLNLGEMETKYHTATHLLHTALSKVLGSECRQSGSNITAERLRFDFTFGRKLTDSEIKEVEDLVNVKIKENLPVKMTEMSVKDAKESGAIGVFDSKYGDKVKVYSIGSFSKEICGGPHVKNTGELGKFKITKEESSSAGIRRIRAELK